LRFARSEAAPKGRHFRVRFERFHGLAASFASHLPARRCKGLFTVGDSILSSARWGSKRRELRPSSHVWVMVEVAPEVILKLLRGDALRSGMRLRRRRQVEVRPARRTDVAGSAEDAARLDEGRCRPKASGKTGSAAPRSGPTITRGRTTPQRFAQRRTVGCPFAPLGFSCPNFRPRQRCKSAYLQTPALIFGPRCHARHATSTPRAKELLTERAGARGRKREVARRISRAALRAFAALARAPSI
jgi:hypothetical protein